MSGLRSVRDATPTPTGCHADLANAHKAMLYAAGVPDGEAMRNAPHVGISTVWWEGNPCK